jgi:RND family efflux transporter MFP subunit
MFETSTSNQIQASAVVVPAKESRLSFVISGLVKEVPVAEGEQVQAGQVLVKLETSELEYEVFSAETDLNSAIVDVELYSIRNKEFNFRTFSFDHISPPGEQIEAAQSRVEERRFALEVAKATLAQGTLLAPFEGTVVEVNISPGEYIQPAQVVIVLANLENLQIETTDLSELNVTAVEIGQPATVFIDALDDEFPGTVTAISPIADTLGGDVVYKVTIQLDQKPDGLLWGMSADVDLNLE